MKKTACVDQLLNEVAEAQRKPEAELDNDPAKLLAHYKEVQKRYADRLIRRCAPDRVRKS